MSSMEESSNKNENKIHRYLCARCRQTYAAKQKKCTKCKAIFSIVKVPASMQVSKPKRMVASEIMKQKTKGEKLEGFEFVGYLPNRFSCAIHGEPGAGKSYFAFQFADAIANKSKKRTFYCCSEEDFSGLDFQNKITYCKTSDKLEFQEIANKKELENFIKNNQGANFIIDSASDLEIKPNYLKSIFRHKKNGKHTVGILIYILHARTDGKHKGGTRMTHDPQLEIYAKDQVAYTGKNRFGKTGESFEIFKDAKENDEGTDS